MIPDFSTNKQRRAEKELGNISNITISPALSLLTTIGIDLAINIYLMFSNAIRDVVFLS